MKKAPEKFRFAAVAVDAVLFGFDDEGTLMVFTQTINRPPYYVDIQGLPGGIVRASENTDQAVARVLHETAGIDPAYTEQLYTFSAVNRDKRNRVVSVAYIGCVRPDVIVLNQYKRGGFMPVKDVKKLAYDHNEVLDVAIERLTAKLSYTTIAQFLLPRHFTLTQLQGVYERVLDRGLDKRNFRKKILALNVLKDTGRKEEGVQNRPAALYTFSSSKLIQLPLEM